MIRAWTDLPEAPLSLSTYTEEGDIYIHVYIYIRRCIHTYIIHTYILGDQGVDRSARGPAVAKCIHRGGRCIHTHTHSHTHTYTYIYLYLRWRIHTYIIHTYIYFKWSVRGQICPRLRCRSVHTLMWEIYTYIYTYILGDASIHISYIHTYILGDQGVDRSARGPAVA